jgi:hypothetical protein
MTTAQAGGGPTRGQAARRRRPCRPGRALRELWGWLSGTGYRPERHYMRGGSVCPSGTSR